jgi:CRISPR-associated Csx2 family protein
MSGYTLIYSVGIGMYKSGYEDTTYEFPNGEKCKTSLFLKAILKTKYRDIKKVILIGTTSSGWNLLIPDGEENTDLWLKTIGECEKNAFCDESKKELETKLSEWYDNIKFEIVIHTNEINEDGVVMVFDKYMDIPCLLEPETDILFDITHGFRSMPLLIFQSLQLKSSYIKDRKVELVYGEYIKEKNTSHVRDLSKYWDYYEINSAIKLFDEKWDGKILAEKIKQEGWETGAKFLERFSEIVECNFSLQLPEALKQLKNALADYNKTGKPKWVTEVHAMLDNIYKKLMKKNNDGDSDAKIIWEYSKLLREKKLITQAVIALQVVVETAIAEKYDPSKKGDYAWFYGYFDTETSKRIDGIGEKYLNKIRNRKENHKMSCDLGQLTRLRNQIAHGGGKDKKGNYPHQASIPGILKPIDNDIKELFTALDKEK